MGTNIDGKRKVVTAMTAIKGVGRRYANIVLKKADVDLTKRAGECTEEEVSVPPPPPYCLPFSNPSFPIICPGREAGDDHPEPTPIQDPELVPQQAEGHHRRQVHPADFLQFGLEAA